MNVATRLPEPREKLFLRHDATLNLNARDILLNIFPSNVANGEVSFVRRVGILLDNQRPAFETPDNILSVVDIPLAAIRKRESKVADSFKARGNRDVLKYYTVAEGVRGNFGDAILDDNPLNDPKNQCS